MIIKEQVLQTVKKKFASSNWEEKAQIPEIINEENFFLQKGQDAYHNFIDADISVSRLDEMLKIFSTGDKASKDTSDSFWTETHILMSYLKKHYCIKSNGYYGDDKGDARVVAEVTAQANNWITWLLKIKKEYVVNGNPNRVSHKNYVSRLPSALGYTLKYIYNPSKEISIVNEDNRKLLSIVLLGKPDHNDDSFCDDIQNIFVDYKSELANPINFSILCARILYEKDIVKLWHKHK